MRRRLGIAALLLGLTASVASALLWFVWLPGAVEQRVAEVAARRGLVVAIAGVRPGLDDIELRGLEVRGGDSLSVSLDRVMVHAGLFALVREGRAAIQRVTASGIQITVELGASDLDEVVRRLRGAETAEVAGPHLPLPEIALTDASLVVRDETGPLARVADGDLQVIAAEVVRVSTGAVAIGDEEESITFASSDARFHLQEERWRVDSVVAREASLAYAERDAVAQSAIWARVRRGAQTIIHLFAAEVDRPNAGGSEGEATAESEQAHPARVAPERAGAEPTEDATGERTGGPSPGESSAELEPQESSAAAVSRLARALAPRLAAGAALRLEGLAVIARSADGDRSVLRELRAEVRLLPRDRYRFEGSGRPGRGGRLGWNLTVDPAALRAEGDVNFQRLPFALLVPFLPELPWHRPEDARLTGDLTVRGGSGSRIHLEGNAQIEELSLSAPRIAPSPVRRISASFEGEAEWLPSSHRLEIARSTVGLGRARAALSGSLEWSDDHYLVDVQVTLPPTDCNTAVGAIPADLLADANAFTFRGRIGGRLAARVDSRDLEGLRLDVDVADGCMFVTAPGFADVRRFGSSFVHHVVEPDGTTFTMETGPETLTWAPMSQISPFLVQAVLGHEDGGFFRHSGFSEPSIRLALIRNLRAGRYVYGASTITMQLVKNVFLHREKTLARKVQEVLLTWWIESVMDKRAILELYLNVIEYGPEIYGIRAAAMHYFGRTPATLGPAESAYLATILPNPKAFHSHWEDNVLPASHRRRVARFLRSLGSRHRYDARAVDYGLSRLEGFHFHRPGEPVGLPPEDRGDPGPLPIETALLVPESWDEDADQPAEEEGWDPGQASRTR